MLCPFDLYHLNTSNNNNKILLLLLSCCGDFYAIFRGALFGIIGFVVQWLKNTYHRVLHCQICTGAYRLEIIIYHQLLKWCDSVVDVIRVPPYSGEVIRYPSRQFDTTSCEYTDEMFEL